MKKIIHFLLLLNISLLVCFEEVSAAGNAKNKQIDQNIVSANNGQSQINQVVKERANIVIPTINTNLQGQISINFPWDSKVASAVFVRGKYLWIIFNKYAQFDLKPISEYLKEKASLVEQVNNKNNSVIRIAIKELKDVSVKKQNQNWLVNLDFKDSNLKPNKSITQYVTPFSKGIFFPVENFSEQLLMILDPEVGDELTIVAIYDESQGVAQKRKFVDFSILKTAQGFVSSVHSDGTYINLIKAGIEVIVPGNHLVKNDTKGFIKDNVVQENKNQIVKAEEKISSEKKTDANTATLLKLSDDKNIAKQVAPSKDKEKKERIIEENQFQLKDISLLKTIKLNPNKFIAHKSLLDFEIMNATKKNKTKIYSMLAKFYFAHSMFYEAAAVLEMLSSNYEYGGSSDENLFMLGVARFMIDQYLEAKKSFDRIDSTRLSEDHSNELVFWKNVIQVKIIGFSDNLNMRQEIPLFISSYPNIVSNKLLFEVLKYQIYAKANYNLSNWLISYLENNVTDLYMGNNLLFLRGEIAKKEDDTNQALEIWKELAKNEEDRENYMKAKLAYNNSLLDKKIMPLEMALDELNALRLKWRNSEEEVALLKKIAFIYNQLNDYVNELKTWGELENSNSIPEDRIYIASQKSNAFIRVFTSKDLQDSISDFDAVALFYEYRESMPIGKIGDQIISNLIGRLIRLDLLDRAATLLNHQIHYRLTGRDKDYAVIELAQVYLSNKRPDLALKLVTEFIQMNPEDEVQQTKLRCIKARSYFVQDQFDKALEIVQEDYSKCSNSLKSYIYFSQNKWEELKLIARVNLIEIEKNQDYGKDFQEVIEKLVICYYMLNDLQSINALYDQYKDVMGKETYAYKLITLVINLSDSLDPKYFDQTLHFEQVQDFIESYKKSLKVPDVL